MLTTVSINSDTGYRAVPRVPIDVDDYGEEFKDLPVCPAFKQIGELRGPFDLGLIPIGAYWPRWYVYPPTLVSVFPTVSVVFFSPRSGFLPGVQGPSQKLCFSSMHSVCHVWIIYVCARWATAYGSREIARVAKEYQITPVLIFIFIFYSFAFYLAPWTRGV